MFLHYIFIAVRNLLRTKLYTAINLLGLSLGLGGALLIVTFMFYESSYEQHENKDRIYRVDGAWQTAGNSVTMANIMSPVGPELKNNITGIEEQVRVRKLWDANFYIETKFFRLFQLGAIVAGIIACLGLAGVAAFSAERRTKEIGIRKTLGASLRNIMGLLSRELILLVFIGCVAGLSVAAWVLIKWLDDFAYRMSLSWELFVATAFMVLIGSILSVAGLTYRAASANPVDSLKYE